MFGLLPLLPWVHIVVGAVVAYLFGFLWYGVWFNKQYMALVENKSKKTNCVAMTVQFLGLLMLAYLIGILSLLPELYLLGTDALIGTILLITLAGALFHYGNNKRALRFWLITGGYEMVATFIIFLIIGLRYFF